MPPKTKDKKVKSESCNYKPKKRKVISPLQVSEQIVRTKDSGGNSIGQSSKQSSISVSPVCDQQNPNKRFHTTAPNYFDFSPYFTSNIESLAAMSMNFPQIPFGAGSQFVQSPPFHPQFSGSVPDASTSSQPQWATQITDDLQSIKTSVSKKSIERLVQQINIKVDDLESKVKTINNRVGECEASNKFVSDQFEEQKTKLKLQMKN